MARAIKIYGADGISWKVRPHVFDDEAEEACLWGQCHALALAINLRLPSELVAVYDGDDVIHVAVRLADGNLLDAAGYYADDETLAKYYEKSAAEVRPVSREVVLALSRSSLWREPVTELAETWVDELISSAVSNN